MNLTKNIQYVDLDGLRLFASELRESIHNHIFELNIIKELDNKIDSGAKLLYIGNTQLEYFNNLKTVCEHIHDTSDQNKYIGKCEFITNLGLISGLYYNITLQDNSIYQIEAWTLKGIAVFEVNINNDILNIPNPVTITPYITLKTINGENLEGPGNIQVVSEIPDWNANNTSEGHILHRTHYTELITRNAYEFPYTTQEWQESLAQLITLDSSVNQIHLTTGIRSEILNPEYDFDYTVGSDPVEFTVCGEVDSIEGEVFTNLENQICIIGYQICTPEYVDSNSEFFVHIQYPYIKQLDEFYIPDTITRNSDLATINGNPIINGGNIDIVSHTAPDWNATEEESGYIENKPCYLNDKLGDLNNNNDYIETDRDYYYYSYVYLKYGSTIKKIQVDFDNNVKIINAPPIYLKFEKTTNNNLKITLIDDYEYVKNNTLYIFGEIIKLSEEFIPYTIAHKSDLESKQDLLVSGTNLKTINNQSLLGTGNITISGGGSESDLLFVNYLADVNTEGGIPVYNKTHGFKSFSIGPSAFKILSDEDLNSSLGTLIYSTDIDSVYRTHLKITCSQLTNGYKPQSTIVPIENNKIILIKGTVGRTPKVKLEVIDGKLNVYNETQGWTDSSQQFSMDVGTIIPLDPMFIPDEIARTSQFATINGQSILQGGNIIVGSEPGGSAISGADWMALPGQNTYIKNKTHGAYSYDLKITQAGTYTYSSYDMSGFYVIIHGQPNVWYCLYNSSITLSSGPPVSLEFRNDTIILSDNGGYINESRPVYIVQKHQFSTLSNYYVSRPDWFADDYEDNGLVINNKTHGATPLSDTTQVIDYFSTVNKKGEVLYSYTKTEEFKNYSNTNLYLKFNCNLRSNDQYNSYGTLIPLVNGECNLPIIGPSAKCQIFVSDDLIKVTLTSPQPGTVDQRVKISIAQIKKLDELYIPDTIARKSDLETLQQMITSLQTQIANMQSASNV